VSETLEHTARRIAEHGREALLARLRPAFEEAAAAHRDALTLDDEQLERMVQRAADRADGLQWRRALASVATEQLGIGLGEALSHPAVARAQAIVGAPSYEEALGALGSPPPTNPKPATDPVPPVAAEAKPPAAAEAKPPAAEAKPPAAEEKPPTTEDSPLEDARHDEPDAAPEDDLAPSTAEHDLPSPVPAVPHPKADELDADEPDGLRLRAVHLGGIANLAPAEGDLELHISSVGLDIVRGPEQSVLGRLTWAEIEGLDTPEIGGRFRRKKQPDAHLVVRSPQGSASFEIPGVTSAELREYVAPMLAQHK